MEFTASRKKKAARKQNRKLCEMLDEKEINRRERKCRSVCERERLLQEAEITRQRFEDLELID